MPKQTNWNWRKHLSRASGKLMLSVTYYGSLSDKPITEYFPVLHEGYAGQKARHQLFAMANSSSADFDSAPLIGSDTGLDYISGQMNKSSPPNTIEYTMENKFHRVVKRSWI